MQWREHQFWSQQNLSGGPDSATNKVWDFRQIIYSSGDSESYLKNGNQIAHLCENLIKLHKYSDQHSISYIVETQL